MKNEFDLPYPKSWPAGTNLEVIDFPIFDAMVWTPDYETLEFFTIPLGLDLPKSSASFPGGGRSKFKIYTNMVLPNKLPSPQQYFLRGVSLCTEEEDCDILIRSSLEITIGQKTYFTLSPSILAYCVNRIVIEDEQTIDPGKRPGWQFSTPYLFDSDINFRALLTFPKATFRPKKSVLIYVVFHGNLYRPIH